MSNEEKKRRDKHQKIRKIWSTIILIYIGITIIALVTIFIMYRRSNELIYVNYNETSKADYEVELLDNEFFKDVAPRKAYPTSLVNKLNATIEYKVAMDRDNVDYSYSYNIKAYIQYTHKTEGEFDPVSIGKDDQGQEIDIVISEKNGTQNSSTNLVITENVSVDFQKANTTATQFLDYLNDSSAGAQLVVQMTISVISSCEDFVEDEKNTHTVTLTAPLAVPTTSVTQTSSVPTSESNMLACTRAGQYASIFKVSLYATAIGLVIGVIALFIFLSATRNKDVDYANTISRILRGYKTFIQISLSRFSSNGYKIIKIRTIEELIQIRDTLQKPVILCENEDKTCSKFFIIDNDVMYLHGICVEGFEDLLEQDDYDDIVEVIETNDVLEEANDNEEVVVEEAPVVTNEDLEDLEDEEEDASTFRELKKLQYTFEAKLILSDEETKIFYRDIKSFILSYGVKVVRSNKRERIYLGRRLFALFTFSGKKLCVSMALDPKEYEGSKYRFKDKSDVRKFAETPFVMKVTSGLKVRYIKELLQIMFENAGIKNKNLEVKLEKIPHKSRNRLIHEGLIKIGKITIEE